MTSTLCVGNSQNGTRTALVKTRFQDCRTPKYQHRPFYTQLVNGIFPISNHLHLFLPAHKSLLK
uniref:Ovule protein n=1 Tax=Mesocestoides corti TaxID=53468 RepID=A0A5K3ER95_MESCO